MNKGTDGNIMQQLGMTADEYSLVTVLYYVSWYIGDTISIDYADQQIPYIVAETPSNLLIKRLLPSRWQSRIMVYFFLSGSRVFC